MKSLFIPFFFILWSISALSQPLAYEDYALMNEMYPENYANALEHCRTNHLPVWAKSAEGDLIQLIALHNDAPLYVQMSNPANPYVNSKLISLDDLYALTGNQPQNIRFYGESFNKLPAGRNLKDFPDSILLIPDRSSEDLYIFDAQTGDLLSMVFYTEINETVSTCVQAYVDENGQLIMSDQLEDVLFSAPPLGNTIEIFAPDGAVNNAILDNVRGFDVDADNNYYVTVGSGANSDAIAKFDNAGNSLGNFIEPGTADSPFDIVLRSSDVLVGAITTDAIHRYDLTGTYLDDFAGPIGFPEQVYETEQGDILVANFQSGESGILIYQADGTFVKGLTCISGTRGVYPLPNGNLLASNGSGVYEIDVDNDLIVRTIAEASFGFIEKVSTENIVWPDNMVNASALEICQDPVTLSTTEHPLLSYEWLLYGENAGLPDAFSVETDVPGDYQCVATFGEVWSDTSDVLTISQISITIQQNANELSVPDGYLAYAWYMDEVVIEGATSNVYTAEETGAYFVLVDVDETCTLSSDTVDVIINKVDDLSNGNTFVVMPNPTDGAARLKFKDNHIGHVELLVTDLNGKEMIRYEFTKYNTDYVYPANLAWMPEGIYFIHRVENGKIIDTQRVVLEKD